MNNTTATIDIERTAERYHVDPAEIQNRLDKRNGKGFENGYDYISIERAARDVYRSEASRHEREERVGTDRSAPDPQLEHELTILRFWDLMIVLAAFHETGVSREDRASYVRGFLEERKHDLEWFRTFVGQEAGDPDDWQELIDMVLCYGKYWYEFGYDIEVFTAYTRRAKPQYCGRVRCQDMFVPQRPGTKYCEAHRR